jgi:hypothetical protein
VRQDIEFVKNMIKDGRRVFVSLAPSWSGIFDYTPQAAALLFKKLGFEGVSETALGAQEVSIKTALILKDGRQDLYISGACPAAVDYIRLYKPKFTRNIVPIASPALTHAKMLKEHYGDDISVVFIGPCIAKKNEAKKHPELISAAITFEELKLWMNEEFIDASHFEDFDCGGFIWQCAYEGALYPIEGGMNDTIKQTEIAGDVQYISLSSLPSIEHALKGYKPSGKKIFLEVLACSGGCVNGPCAGAKKSGISITSEILSKIKKREKIPQIPQAVVNETYKPSAVEYKLYSFPEISKAMKKIGKHTEEDELNCGGCGYPTCKDLASALISGVAEPSMCVSYMRKIAMRKADAMLRCMPAAVVIVDDNLNIVEANDAFMRMFCDKDSYKVFTSRPDGLAGAAIDKIIDFPEIFKQALESGKDIHKEHFHVKNKLYDITAFTIENNEIAGAIIIDVTQSEMNREKIAQKARDVITKNVATVQEIACLLGEHMVETELLLNSIAEDYEDDVH